VGPYSIPIPILKRWRHLILSPLETLYNLSNLSGKVPDGFKVAKGVTHL
jgi:hypothetical protein